MSTNSEIIAKSQNSLSSQEGSRISREITDSIIKNLEQLNFNCDMNKNEIDNLKRIISKLTESEIIKLQESCSCLPAKPRHQENLRILTQILEKFDILYQQTEKQQEILNECKQHRQSSQESQLDHQLKLQELQEKINNLSEENKILKDQIPSPQTQRALQKIKKNSELKKFVLNT